MASFFSEKSCGSEPPSSLGCARRAADRVVRHEHVIVLVRAAENRGVGAARGGSVKIEFKIESKIQSKSREKN